MPTDAIPGLASLRGSTLGDPRVVVAIVDGAVDVGHPALASARIGPLPGERLPPAERHDQTAIHGTHVASVVFGQPETEVSGVAPYVTGLVIPVFDRKRRRVPQLEIARAIERAVDAGAHVVNVSGGQYTDSGDADDWLERAVELCEHENVLLVAAAGNDGCDCLHVPAALDAALAVGALGEDGEPLDTSNWGASYLRNGILAPGHRITGAVPGGGVVEASGTSAAAPIVTGVAALLLSQQAERGERPDPLSVRRALLFGARPCTDTDPDACRRLLGGVLDLEGAIRIMAIEQQPADEGATQSCATDDPPARLATVMPDLTETEPAVQSTSPPDVAPTKASGVEQSQADEAGGGSGGLVYALGTLGYDFGTEARRDSFKQLMAPTVIDDQAVPANPFDSRQMVEHLNSYPSEAQALIWTLNLELTPLYAVEAMGPFATDVYVTLRQILEGENAPPSSQEFIERVSIPGRLAGRSTKLFSGQVVPVVVIDTTRGLYGWRTNWLVQSAVENVQQATEEDIDEETVSAALSGFLNRVYYDMRNLGVLSKDRALNFAATNAFQATTAFAEALAVGMQLDTIDVEPSAYARMDADAWDVKLKFFDPENLRRARKVFRFSVDVSEESPVTLGEVRTWSVSQ